jgi:hypothetical protein
MTKRLWHLLGHGLMHFRWPLASLAALAVILACVLVIPQWLVRWELGASARTLTVADKAKAINDVRATLLQGVGGAVILLGAYFTYRQLQTSREGQVTERFTRAIDQLGHAVLDVRLGGIYALERIANDSPYDRATIAEVLTAFVRGHGAWTEPADDSAPSLVASIDELPDLRVRAADVQAAMTVLGRRALPPGKAKPLLLTCVDLRRADLDGANLDGANLGGANISSEPARCSTHPDLIPPLNWRVIPRPSGRSWLLPIPDQPRGPALGTPQGSGRPRSHARASDARSPRPFPIPPSSRRGDLVADLEQGPHDKPFRNHQRTRSRPTVGGRPLWVGATAPRGALRPDTSPSRCLTDPVALAGIGGPHEHQSGLLGTGPGGYPTRGSVIATGRGRVAHQAVALGECFGDSCHHHRCRRRAGSRRWTAAGHAQPCGGRQAHPPGPTRPASRARSRTPAKAPSSRQRPGTPRISRS